MNVGDRVKIVSSNPFYKPTSDLLGQEGTIIDIPEMGYIGTLIRVRFSGGKEFLCFEDEMEIVPTE